LCFHRQASFGDFFAANRELLDLLFGASAEVLNGWSKEKGFAPGFCSVMHTFGGKLNFHPHIHILFACGGLGKNEELIETNYICWKSLKSRFRAILVRMLREWVKENVLSVPKSVVNIWRKKKGLSEFGEVLCSLLKLSGM